MYIYVHTQHIAPLHCQPHIENTPHLSAYATYDAPTLDINRLACSNVYKLKDHAIVECMRDLWCVWYVTRLKCTLHLYTYNVTTRHSTDIKCRRVIRVYVTDEVHALQHTATSLQHTHIFKYNPWLSRAFISYVKIYHTSARDVRVNITVWILCVFLRLCVLMDGRVSWRVGMYMHRYTHIYVVNTALYCACVYACVCVRACTCFCAYVKMCTCVSYV